MDAAKAQPSSDALDGVDQEVLDEYDLAALGHEQVLSRKFDIWSILALAFCVLGTWSTFAQVGGDRRTSSSPANNDDTGPRQRPLQRRTRQHPLGPGARDGVQPLRGRLARRAVQQHAHGAGPGVLGPPAVGHARGPVRLVPVRVDQHVRVVGPHGVAGGLYGQLPARHAHHVRPGLGRRRTGLGPVPRVPRRHGALHRVQPRRVPPGQGAALVQQLRRRVVWRAVCRLQPRPAHRGRDQARARVPVCQVRLRDLDQPDRLERRRDSTFPPFSPRQCPPPPLSNTPPPPRSGSQASSKPPTASQPSTR